MTVGELVKVLPVACDVFFVNTQQADLGVAYSKSDEVRPPRKTSLDDCEVICIMSVDTDSVIVMVRNENDVDGQEE